MVAAKVSCPFCRAVLKSKKFVPAGAALTCPQCRKGFRVGIDTPSPSGQAKFVRGTADSGGSNLPPRSKAARLLVLGALMLALGAGGVWWFIAHQDAPESKILVEKGPEKDKELIIPPDDGKPREKEKTKPLIELTPEEEKLVKEMTRKGVDWLKTAQRADGTWGEAFWKEGEAALAGLALLSCGVLVKDTTVQMVARRVRSLGPEARQTYELALYVLFLDRLNDPADAALLEGLASRLIAGQKTSGGWGYVCPTHSVADHMAVIKALRDLDKQGGSLLRDKLSDEESRKLAEVLASLPGHLRGVAAFARGVDLSSPTDEFRSGDNSNTQFAILALWAARKRGLPVDRTLQLAVRHFKESQSAEGSWSYAGWKNSVYWVENAPKPTMTCAGLLGMAVEYGVRGKEEVKGVHPEDNPAIKKGLEVLARSLTSPRDEKAKKEGVKAPYPTLYFIWSIERVGMLFELKEIGGKDWYRWGLDILQDHQLADGRWPASWSPATSSDAVDTSFALLFLNRVNLAADLTDRLIEIKQGSRPVAP